MAKADDVTLQRAAEVYQDFMNIMGIPLDANSRGTAMRVARMFYNEKCLAYRVRPPVITTFPNEGVDQYVVVRDIPYFSICAHHHVSFSGVAHIVYHPGKKLAGLSKFARVVKHFAAKPQIQEELTREIADYLFKELEPVGIAVQLEGRHLCYDDKTEILTKSGWKLFKDLLDEDEVMQYSPDTEYLSWTKWTNRVALDYEGTMLSFGGGKSLSLVVTPDHRMVYKTDWSLRTGKGYSVCRARELEGKKVVVPVAGKWVGSNPATAVLGDREVPFSLYCAFMGIFIAEGSTSAGKTRITQVKYRSEVKELLDRIGIHYTLSGKNFDLLKTNKGLYEQLAVLGMSGDMSVPREILDSTIESIDIFLYWYGLGDGNSRLPYGEASNHYVSKSARLMDNIQELYLKKNCGTTVLTRRGHSRLNTRYSKGVEGKNYLFTGKEPKSVEYKGKVYCVSVPDGALVVRREGRIAISGNCMEERGVQAVGSRTVTQKFLGNIDKNEVATLIGNKCSK